MSGSVLITGVAGFLGSHLADALLAGGSAVRGIDNLSGGYKDNVPDGVEFRDVDCRSISEYSDLLDGVDTVYHCAAAAYEGLSVFAPYHVDQHTCSATVAVLSASAQAGVRRFVHCSSMSRYGDGVPPFHEDMTPEPVTPYGIAKYAAELMVRSICGTHGMEFNIAVPHNIIGPRQRYDDPYRNVAAIMINRMLQGKQPVIYGDGSQVRCFSFVADVVSCLVALGEDPSVQGEVVNVGPDENPVTVLHLAETIAEALGMECDPVFVPARPLEVHHATCSSDKARRLLGYETRTSLRDGIADMVEWMRARGPRPFEYDIELEIVSAITPSTWTAKLI
ncbi:NAD-dependent epimerase/dehydratase family protein [Actinomadura logoneensis]|uniref:NAD-dependent epimerase/dehydratase family protein n=1 Tax=Actinomadura logoneensis TaxID=2293572 RepID=A0A372JC37_9ACTN|nr:NAD-dependent epimerase/dehydratase family protein [Actinomadura logoneensis]RFU37573.1 NAD-dependent epimerase/dehydratase family protein [Actinomadura logoneensis]